MDGTTVNELWKHILYPHYATQTFRKVDDFRKIADELGYSMYMWNGWVYETSTGKTNGIKINDDGDLTS